IAGLLLSNLEERLRTPGVVAAMLVLVGVAMAAAERWLARHLATSDTTAAVTPLRAVGGGVAQAWAVLAGGLPPGGPISAGIFAGLGRAAAARFSFLLAAPVTVAAAVKELPELRHASDQGITAGEIGIGIAASFVVGVAAIAFLLRFLAGHSLYPFV